ncbi:MAG TPA: alkene reductase [Blastocatellia bacterium]|nr:alkene reductase [Blastocatellia bacterium]
MSDNKTLFTPVRIGAVELKNRIVMAPMTRNRAGEGLAPTDLNVTYYAQRASAGLIVTEATQVSPRGVGYPNTPGIHTEEQVAGWRRVTDAVHERGGRIFLQLWHVGRISHPSLQPNGELPVAPSAIAPEGKCMTYEGPKPFVTPRALETAEIAGVVAEYAHGARLAKEAGFDGVEIHAANGYLIDQFLQDNSNHRTDEYGGSVENRVRFLVEVTSAVVDVWGANRVGVRLSPRGTFNSMGDSDRAATFSHAVAELAKFNLAYLHLLEAVDGPMASSAVPGERLTPRLRKIFHGPIIANGGYDETTAIAAIERGEVDLVAFGIPFIANPDLPERFATGAPLAKADQATFYGGDAHGYIDYPSIEAPVGAGR